MNQMEFEGELKYIPPTRFFKNKDENSLTNFFLVLGIIHNDFKGILLFQKLLADTYRTPIIDERSVHSGEYNGLHIQLTRLLIGGVHEFFEFLKENEGILSTTEFNEILENVNSTTKSAWKDIVDITFEKPAKESEFTYNIMLIRNNVSFHYNQSGKEIGKAFRNIFFNREKIGFNEKAYYCIEDGILNTRFFFADAAAEEYIRTKSEEKKLESMSGYSPEMLNIVGKINLAISKLLGVYLKKLPKGLDE